MGAGLRAPPAAISSCPRLEPRLDPRRERSRLPPCCEPPRLPPCSELSRLLWPLLRPCRELSRLVLLPCSELPGGGGAWLHAGKHAAVSTCTEVATASVAAVSSAQAVPPDSSPAIDVGAQEDAIPQQVESTSEMPDSAPPGSSALVSPCPEVATAAVTAVSSAQALPPDSSPIGVPASSALDAMDRPVSSKSDSVRVSDRAYRECPPQ